ncbi:hypothetical protein VTO42DRAFT_593 [Malbranchea cinnamomea]
MKDQEWGILNKPFLRREYSQGPNSATNCIQATRSSVERDIDGKCGCLGYSAKSQSKQSLCGSAKAVPITESGTTTDIPSPLTSLYSVCAASDLGWVVAETMGYFSTNFYTGHAKRI